MQTRILLYLFVLISSNSLFSQSILSGDRYWDNGGSGDSWVTNPNWDGVGTPPLPEFNSDVHINNNLSATLPTGNSILVESLAIGADNSNNVGFPIMVSNTRGHLTIEDGATLTLTKGGHDGSNSLRLEGTSGNESTLNIDGTLILQGDANGNGLYIHRYSSVTVEDDGELNVTAKNENGIRIRDDLINSGTIEITATSSCLDGIRDDGPRSGSKITNNSIGSLTIDGGGFMRYGMYLDDVEVDNLGTVTISGTTDNILEGDFVFNNYGTFAGDGIVAIENFVGGGAGSHISPGTDDDPIGKITFSHPVDLSNNTIDIQINSTSSYDQIESRLLGDIDITDAILSLSGAYVPQPADEFILIEKTLGGTITGSFANQGTQFVFNGVTVELSQNLTGQIVLSYVGALPVELISFNGEATDQSNILKWQTATEENTMVFILERSLNSINNFREIDRINAVGNSTELNTYETEDRFPEALAYYRLRIVDFDGTYEFSDIIAIEREPRIKDVVEVFPIPAEDDVTVVIHSQTGGKAIMILSDLLGRKIKMEHIILDAGTNHYTLNLGTQEANLYFLTIDNGKEKIAKKILRASRY